VLRRGSGVQIARSDQIPVRGKVPDMRLRLLCLLFPFLPASGQILVRVNDAPPVQISAADLAKLPGHTAILNNHGQRISYEGALMRDVLALGGIDFGKELRGKQLSSYVSALGSDGYQVVFALAEFDPTVMDSDILIANRREGQPLAANEGVLRIVVPHDKRPTRSLRLLQEIDVVQLKK
jgi:hypothetical protein